MKKIVISLHTGYCGMDAKEGWEVPDDISEAELDDLCWSRALEHAEMYGIYPPNSGSDDIEDMDDMDTDGDNISNNIEGSCEAYDPKKHDGYLTYGHGDKPSFSIYA